MYVYVWVCIYIYISINMCDIYLGCVVCGCVAGRKRILGNRIWGLQSSLVNLGSAIGKALNSGIRVWLELRTSSRTLWGKQRRRNPTKDSCCVGFLHLSPQPPAQSPSRGLSMSAKGAKFSDDVGYDARTNPSAASGLFWPHHLRRSLHLVPPMSPPQ